MQVFAGHGMWLTLRDKSPQQFWADWREAHKQYEVELVYLARGILAGLVGIAAGAVVLEPWAAIICGGIAALVFYGAETVRSGERGPRHGEALVLMGYWVHWC